MDHSEQGQDDMEKLDQGTEGDPEPARPGHARLRARVAELERRLADATRFVEPMIYFQEWLAADREFQRLGRPGTHERLAIALETCLARVVGPQIRLARRSFLEVAELGIWHGFFRIAGRGGFVFHLERTGQGLVVLFREAADGRADLLRFSIVDLETEPGTPPICGPDASA